jgi:Domain of unknown function (DUF222)
VQEAFAAINANPDTVATLVLNELEPGDLLQTAALTGKSIRRHTVVSHDLSYQLGRHTVGEIGGPASRVLADWLRISPAEARRRARVTEPMAERTTLTGERLAPSQAAAAEAGGRVTSTPRICGPSSGSLRICRSTSPRPSVRRPRPSSPSRPGCSGRTSWPR